MIADTGLLIALDRHVERAEALVRDHLRRGGEIWVPSAVEAQAVRQVQGQVRLVRALDGMFTVPLDRAGARAIGQLLARTETNDVVDGHVAVVASRHPGPVVTSDADDLARLGIHPDRLVEV